MIDTTKPFELRMYFFVPYNISPIQQAIQAGHAALRYAYEHGHNSNERFPLIWDFICSHETWVILNGGTTNKRRDLDGIALGTLDQIGDSLLENKIPFAYFEEPDLNDALTAVCFIGDERIWNYDDYLDFVKYIIDKGYNGILNPQKVLELRMMEYESLKEKYYDYYEEWVQFIGGEKNVFLRELIKGKKLA